jgi:hypothetical protein
VNICNFLLKITQDYFFTFYFFKGPWILQTVVFVSFMFPLMKKMQSAKFEIEKFNGKNNFEIWKVKMHDLLVQQGVVKALLGKEKQPASITDEDWDEMDARALSAIRCVWPTMYCSTLLQRRQQSICGQS